MKLVAEASAPTVKKIFSICSMIFTYATVMGLFEGTPPNLSTKGMFKHYKETNHAAVTDSTERVGEIVYDVIKLAKRYPIAGYAMLFLVYNFTRPVEMRNLTWKNINWEKNEIRYRKEQTKTRIELIVPFSAQTRKILEELHQTAERETDYVFYSPKLGGKYKMSDAFPSLIMKNHLKISADEQKAHGFRSVASTFLRERPLSFESELVEIQLGHVVGTAIARRYNKSQRLEERREMLQRWADWIDEQVEEAKKKERGEKKTKKNNK